MGVLSFGSLRDSARSAPPRSKTGRSKAAPSKTGRTKAAPSKTGRFERANPGGRRKARESTSRRATGKAGAGVRRRRGPGVAGVAGIAVILMIAVAVTLQAQRVTGQEHLQAVRAETREHSRHQAELRAAVAEAEAPSQILEAAGLVGMVEPAAVVAVPAPVSANSSGELVERG